MSDRLSDEQREALAEALRKSPLADHIRDARSAEVPCNHWIGQEIAVCAPCVRDRVAPHITDTLAPVVARMLTDARAEALREAEATHRDLTRRLGFGDNIAEPQADNDTIVAWFEQQGRDANEWVESQLWRNDCYAKGHPDDEDCFECDPMFAYERGLAEGRRLGCPLTEHDGTHGPLIRQAKAEALREAADKWQIGDWANVLLPKPAPPAVPAIAYSNRVLDWLRDRAAVLAEPTGREGEQ